MCSAPVSTWKYSAARFLSFSTRLHEIFSCAYFKTTQKISSSSVTLNCINYCKKQKRHFNFAIIVLNCSLAFGIFILCPFFLKHGTTFLGGINAESANIILSVENYCSGSFARGL